MPVVADDDWTDSEGGALMAALKMEAEVRRLPILRSLLAQALMLLLLLGLARLGVIFPLWMLLLLQAVGSALLGLALGLSLWWLPINLAFVPGLYWAQQAQLASSWPLLGVLLLLALFSNSLRERVPLYLSDGSARRQVQTYLRSRDESFRFVDLGCGIGSMLCPMARAFPKAQFVGVETAPLSFLLAWLRSLPLPNCQVRYRSLWLQPLSGFDVVYCFLSPEPMPALWAKANAEMKAGSVLLSNSFVVPGQVADQQWALGGWRQGQLYLWQMQRRLATDSAAS